MREHQVGNRLLLLLQVLISHLLSAYRVSSPLAREMKASGCPHSPILQLSHPFLAHKALPYSFPSIPSSKKIAGNQHASLLWVRMHRRWKPLQVTVFLLNKDGGEGKDQWYAMDASHVKLLMLGALQRWGASAAVGALVGSIVAQKKLLFFVSSSFIVLMGVYRAMEARGVQLKSVLDVFSMQVLIKLLATTSSLFSTAVLYLSGAFMSWFSKSSKFICQLSAPMIAFLVNTSLSWNQRELRETIKDPTLGIAFKSADTIIAEINACIQNVEGIIRTEKDIAAETNWTELKDSLSSLKTKVGCLSKADRYTATSTDVLASPGSAVKLPIKKLKSSASFKSKGDDLRQSEVDKIHAVGEHKMLVNASADTLKQEATFEMSGEVDAMSRVRDVSLTERVASTKQASAATREDALDLGSGLLLKEINGIAVSDAQPLDVSSVKVGESESHSPRTKYIDYWTEEGPIKSVSSGDVEEQRSNTLSKNLLYQREDFDLPVGHDLEKEIASTGLCPDLHRKRFHSDERTSSVSNDICSENPGSMNNVSAKVKDVDGSTEHVGSRNTERVPRKPGSVNDPIKVARQTDLQDKDILNGSENTFLGTNIAKDSVVEQGTALSGSTKELAFVREDADLHVLTGISRSFNDAEFQKLMTNGESALRHGKAGLYGNIEVGEAETMLCKAAEHFASAAALDFSSVEALGFWGNTLLVHGELKLMLSRELRHLISTPDVVSPYWVRQNKGLGARGNSNRAALQRTFQTVCEECEELLIQAGRKYRRVLSISNSEVRALYNWGLALCFRARLIAEEGGQDAREAADRIYLAAIDKFEAMMGISQRYAPGAMLNWGLTLKERSRLRPSDSAERIGLLQQAKQLCLDALRMQPDDAQIHAAFVTCCVELKELNDRQGSQSRTRKSFLGK